MSEWKDEQGRWNVSGVCACSELKFSGSKLVHYSPPERHERGHPGCPAPRWQRSRERETRQPPPCSVPDIQGSTCSGLAKGEVFRGAPQWPQRGPEIGSSALCPRPTKGWGGGGGRRGGGQHGESLAEPMGGHRPPCARCATLWAAGGEAAYPSGFDGVENLAELVDGACRRVERRCVCYGRRG